MRRISRYQFSRAHASITSYSHPSSTRHSSIWGRLTNGSTVRHKSDGPEAFGKVNNNHTANPRFISSAPLLISGQERKDLFRLLTNNWSLTPDETGLEKSFEFRTFRECWKFMKVIASGAKVKGHHPEWANSYNKLFIRWTTHGPNRLTAKDIQLAMFCDHTSAIWEACMSVSKGKSESGFKVVGSGLLGKLAGTEVEQTQKAGKDKLSLLDDEEHRGEGFTEDVVPGVEEGRRTFDFLKRSPEHKRDVDRAGRKQSLGALKQRREEAGGSIFDEDKEGKGYWLEEEPKAAPEKSVSRAQQVATLSEEHDQDEEQYLGGHQDAEQYILRVLEAKGQFLRDNLDPRYERHIQRVLDGKRVSLRRKLGLDEDNDNVSVQGTQGKQDSASTTSVDLLDYRTNHSNGSLDNGTSTKQDRPSEAKSEPKPRSNALAAAIEDAGGSQRDGEHTSSYISRCVHRKREKLYKHIIPSDHSGMHKAERVIDALKNALKQDLSHGKTVADEMVLYSRQQDLRQHLAGYSEEQRNEPIPGDIVTLPERARQAKTSMEGYIEYCKEIELADKEKLMKGLNPDSEAAKFWLRQVLGAKQGILNRQLRGQTSYVDHAVLRRKEKDFKTWCAANDYGWKSWSSEGPISNVEAVEQSETKPPSTEAISARREDGSSETPTSNVEAAEQSEAESSSTEAARDWTTDESSTSPTSNAEVVEQFKTESPPTEAVRDWSTDESSESPTSNAEAAEQSEAKSSSTEAFSGWGKDGSSESPASNTEAVEQPNTESPSTEAVRGRAKEASSETPTSITEAAEQSETKTASAEAVKNTADE